MKTYDIINAGPNNRFMANGRIVSNSGRGLQLQNLARNSLETLDIARSFLREGNLEALELIYDNVPDVLSQLVRTMFIPKPGCRFIVADFSAIEARALAWVSQEEWRLEAFRNGEDIYCASASRMFGVPVVKHGENGHLRQRGKIAELALGYGGSSGALESMGALDKKYGLTKDELPELVKTWRESNGRITQFWWDVDKAASKAFETGREQWVANICIGCFDNKLQIKLPSGRILYYVNPGRIMNQFGQLNLAYDGVGQNKKWTRIPTYGPKLVENCIAEGTLVITDRGLVPIENITDEMLIWDGEEFVSHEGLIYQGVKETISANGIHMTPDHKILTEGGWKRSAESSGLNWAAVSLPDSFETGREYAGGEEPMAVQVCMREGSSRFSKASEGKESSQILRMYEEATDQRSQHNPRYEPSSRLGSMAQHETEMPGPEPSRLEKLWGKRHNHLRPLAGKLRELLGRHGADLEEGTRLGSDRQRRELHPGKLPMDEQKTERKQQTENTLCQGNAVINDNQADRNRFDDTALSAGSRMAGRITVSSTGLSEPVYDIRNCGSRHRFTVWNGERALIVSNCIQAICRDILADAMLRVEAAGYDIVAHVHDEIICEVPIGVSSVEEICTLMSQLPDWADNTLPLNADGYECDYYKKD